MNIYREQIYFPCHILCYQMGGNKSFENEYYNNHNKIDHYFEKKKFNKWINFY